MLLNSKNSNFFFVFPRGFFPKSVTDKYLPYLKKQPQAYDSIDQLMNSSIQSITFPDLTATTVDQTRYLGKKATYKGSFPIQDLFSRNFNVTFRNVDGYLTYFIMLDTLLYFLNFKNYDVHSNDLVLRITDNSGYIVTSVSFKETVLTTIGNLEFNYTQNAPQYSNFSLGFVCNYIDIILEAKDGI